MGQKYVLGHLEEICSVKDMKGGKNLFPKDFREKGMSLFSVYNIQILRDFKYFQYF